MHGLWKYLKISSILIIVNIVNNRPSFWLPLSAANTRTYNSANLQVPILKFLNGKEYTIKNTVAFAEKNIEQISKLFMGNLDFGSLVINTHFERSIIISTNILFKNTEKVEGLSKIGFKEFLPLPTKESYFFFNGKFFK